MRNIKFRAWHEENKAFVYVTIVDIWSNGFRCAENLQWQPEGSRKTYLTDDELKRWKGGRTFVPNADWKQYTGLKDKNGREIYEEDILTGGHAVEWHDDYDWPGFYISNNKWERSDFPVDWEVIGNVYENPELLEGGK